MNIIIQKLNYPSAAELRQLDLPDCAPTVAPPLRLARCCICTAFWAVSCNADRAFICPECTEYQENIYVTDNA
jgi:hypothetical protein